MTRSIFSLIILALIPAFFVTPLLAQAWRLPERDLRAVEVRRLDTSYAFPAYSTREAWLARAAYLREHILVSTGLWPTPEKGPLNARVFDRLEREGYSVEKVYFESYPGFYVTGNLYRPLGRTGPFPAVLSPHGHWAFGRLENTELSSVPGRAINLARQGYVVFSSDMVGYNDSFQVDHYIKRKGRTSETDPEVARALSLWGLGTLSLQLWNSVRALDFLESLPDVDRSRLACTGASGGGTQTFLLTAIDDRVKVAAPVNMISHSMQGGCTCENAPNLRLDTNNMELGALAAPRPLLMVSATGDWTRETPRVEYPAVRRVYELLGAPERVQTVQIDAPHNYNRESREAVYAWFGRWLLGENDAAQLKEKSFRVESPDRLLVFYGRKVPDGARTQDELWASLKESSERQLSALRPRDRASLGRFRELMRPALAHSLAAEYPEKVRSSPALSERPGGSEDFYLGREGRGDRVPATIWFPQSRKGARTATLLIHPAGREALAKNGGDLLAGLRRKGHVVLSIDAFNTGSARAVRALDAPFFTTYNRTDDANRVQDILTALAFLRERGMERINLIGLGEAGLWSLLARALAPDIGQTIADAARFDTEDDRAYLDGLYIPLLRRAGDFRTALALAPATRLLIHRTAARFPREWARAVYEIEGAGTRLRVEAGELSTPELLAWLE